MGQDVAHQFELSFGLQHLLLHQLLAERLLLVQLLMLLLFPPASGFQLLREAVALLLELSGDLALLFERFVVEVVLMQGVFALPGQLIQLPFQAFPLPRRLLPQAVLVIALLGPFFQLLIQLFVLLSNGFALLHLRIALARALLKVALQPFAFLSVLLALLEGGFEFRGEVSPLFLLPRGQFSRFLQCNVVEVILMQRFLAFLG